MKKNRLTIDIQARRGAFTLEIALETTFQTALGIVGSSGSGKSTILDCIAGLLRPRRGHISYNDTCLYDSKRGINLSPQDRRIGYIFQNNLLFPHYGVRGNLLYGASKPLNREQVDRVMDMLDLFKLQNRRVGQLSGGEKRRVAIGRALLSGPRLLAFDEPLTGIDASRRKEILSYIRALPAQSGVAILYVSHDRDEVHTLTDTQIHIRAGREATENWAESLDKDSQLSPRVS